MAAAPEAGDPGAGLPPATLVRRHDTHRLIPSRYRPGGESVLALIADGDAHLADLFDLDHATNDRLLAEHDLLPGVGVHELVFGVPNYRVVNAAFTHAHPSGSRWNGPDRARGTRRSRSRRRRPRWRSTPRWRSRRWGGSRTRSRTTTT